MKEAFDRIIAKLESQSFMDDYELIIGLDDAVNIVNEIAEETDNGKMSDGYHTFNELYHHRAVLFAVICNTHRELAWKSKKHDTGDMYDGMFIVGIETPEGQATYHYNIDPYWDMFKVKELEYAPKWDGHTPDEAIMRIGLLSEEYQSTIGQVKGDTSVSNNDGWIPCSERLPKVETEVYILTKRKYRYSGDVKYITTTAMYEDGTVRENDSCWIWEDIDGEWDEEEDCYIIPEGWWECRHYNPDEVYNNVVYDEVIAWQPLPQLYQPKGDKK